MSFQGIDSLAKDLAPVIREFVAKELAPLSQRIAALERRDSDEATRAQESIQRGLERVDRLDQRFDRFDQRMDAIALRGVSAGFDEKAIVERTIQAVDTVINDRVRTAVDAIPVPKALTVEDMRPSIEAEVAKAISLLKRSQAKQDTTQRAPPRWAHGARGPVVDITPNNPRPQLQHITAAVALLPRRIA